MSNLSTTQTNLSTNPYLLAMQAPKICDMERKQALLAIGAVITRCVQDSGQVIDKSTLLVLSGNVLDELKVIFRNCTTDEFKMACFSGVRREYGDYFGINLVSINFFIKSFIRSEARQVANRDAKLSAEAVRKPIMSEQDAEAEWRQSITKQFRLFKEKGILEITFPINQFKIFEDRGMINISIADKKEIYEKAKLRVAEMKKTGRVKAKSHTEIKSIGQFLERLDKGELNSTDQTEIKREACVMAIKQYYTLLNELIFKP